MSAPFRKKYVGKCMSTCLCVPLCAFYLLTLRTGIPVPRTCRLSSQRDTERGQSEQRSFVRRECGHEKFGKRHGLRNITKLLLKSPFGRKPSTFDIGAWGWPYVCYLASDSGRLHHTATVHSAWELTPRKNALPMINVSFESLSSSEACCKIWHMTDVSTLQASALLMCP